MSATKISLRSPETAGIASSMELAMRFVIWAKGLGRVPTAAEIQTKFGLARASAYRWRQAWNAVAGTHQPRGH